MTDTTNPEVFTIKTVTDTTEVYDSTDIIITGGTGSSSTSNLVWHDFATIQAALTPQHTVFILPEDRMPEKVYINGSLATIGVIGSEAHYSYNGKDKIVISPQTLEPTSGLLYYPTPKFNNKISIEYDNAIYHYHIEHVPSKEVKTNIIQAKLLSKVERGA